MCTYLLGTCRLTFREAGHGIAPKPERRPTIRKMGFGSVFVVVAALSCHAPCANAQVESGLRSSPRVIQPIDERNRIALNGSVRPEARLENDRGPVTDSLLIEHMLLQLKRSPEQEKFVQQFIDELHTKGSSNFHRWLTAPEFGERFGLAQPDLDAITAWLRSHGFRVNVVYPSGMLIDFSGTAGQVREAFETEIHNLEVKGERHIANMSKSSIPAALAPVISGVVSLHDFRPHTMHHLRKANTAFTFADGLGGTTYAVVPADLATIYNLNALFNSGISGQGQTIVLIEDTDVFSAADWNIFRSTLGLSTYTAASFSTVHPAPSSGSNNCAAPGVIAPNDAEAILDAEWASASAPSAGILMASCADSNVTFGGLIAVQNLINNSTPPPSIMSISYGQCETVNGAASNASYNSAYQQAVAEGVSVFVAAGDSGAAGCDNSVAEATHGIGVNAFASTPYNVAVGGTDFSDTFAGTNGTYWNSSNTPAFGSARSYIPEIPWNDSCAGTLLSTYEGYSPTYGPTSLCNDPSIGSLLLTTVAGGGGPSQCASGTPSTSGVVSGSCAGWPKPSWQSVFGNPNDGVRDTPDVSLFAADGLWSHFYVFCWSDTANGGATCGSDPSVWSGAGGTSFASPIMAGIQALINQKIGSRQGNPNPIYYQLAASEYGSGGNGACNSSDGNAVSSSCSFYDVTQGDMDVDCAGPNCYLGGGSVGVLSTSNTSFSPAYGAATGWDFATGIGTVNAANLVNNWSLSSTSPSFRLSSSPSSVTMTQGASGTSTISVIPQNGFNGNVALSASGLPSGVTASFNPVSTASTSTLTLTASSAATTGTASVTITGTSGSLTSITTVSLTVNPTPVPNFSLSSSPSSVTMTQGASGTSTISVTPQNGFNGNVALSASGLPSGVTASFNPASTASSSILTLTAGSAATTGTASVTITGTSGSLTNITTVSLTVQATTVTTLPSVWTSADVGATGLVGTASYANNVFTVKGAGTQIYGSADSFHFVYQPLSGDGTVIARLVSVQGGTGYEAAGVMIRETLNPGATNANTADWTSNGLIYFGVRTTTGGSTAISGASAKLPYWVKVTRSGNNFSGYTSSDGVNWVQLGTSQTISMAQNVNVGLAVTSGTNSALATATFDNVSVDSASAPAPLITNVSATTGTIGSQVAIQGSNFGASQGSSAVLLNGTPVTINSWSATSLNITIPAGATSGPLLVSIAPSMNDSNPVIFTVTAQPLPSGWLDQDVGSVGLAGSVAYTSGTFTVEGAGTQIYNSADSFHFVYQPLSGDGTVIARLVSVQGGTGYEAAGVMIRETLNPGATNANTADWASIGLIYFGVRTTTGGSTAINGASAKLPYWVKVTRSGSTFSGYTSSDGVNWVRLGTSQTISMAQNVYVGLAVNSGTNSALATATFDNVSITSP